MATAQAIASRDVVEARLSVYRFLLAALDKPTPEQHAWMVSRGFRDALADLADQFALAVPAGELAAADTADHQARYIACFEVGLPTPPVVLLASHYNRREPVTAIIHEHLLFYRCFGAAPAVGNGEPADHALDELAFLIYLDELLLAGRIEAESILRARRDFLRRHVSQWPGRAWAAAEENGIAPVYVLLLGVLTAAIDQDLALAEAELARMARERV
ncbi:MAG TPA: molecular chaperone TorD family protein [Gemmataceae bacterium]|nr:molecular chaperone TorD family protein [Gemmataceae bacterium]